MELAGAGKGDKKLAIPGAGDALGKLNDLKSATKWLNPANWNLMKYNPHVKAYGFIVYLNMLQNFTFKNTLMYYSKYGYYQILFAPLASDLLAALVTYIFMEFNKKEFKIEGKWKAWQMRLFYLVGFALKLAFLYILVRSVFHKDPKLAIWAAAVAGVHVLRDFLDRGFQPYDQLLTTANLTSCCLFLVKYHGLIQFEWNQIFIMNTINGYILMVAGIISNIVVTVTMIMSLLKADWAVVKKLGLGLISTVALMIESSLLFTYDKQMSGAKSFLNIGMLQACIPALAMVVVDFIIGLCAKTPKKNPLLDPKKAQEKKSVSDRVFDFLKLNKSYVDTATIKEDQAREQKEEAEGDAEGYQPLEESEEQICLLCNERPAECIIHPCLHEVVCKTCSRKLADEDGEGEDDAVCPECSQPVDKITEIKIDPEVKAGKNDIKGPDIKTEPKK